MDTKDPRELAGSGGVTNWMRVDMTNGTPCSVCSGPVVGRSDKKVCSPACKRIAKNQYDLARYDQIRDASIARACAHQRANPERKQAYDAQYREDNRERLALEKREWSRKKYLASPAFATEAAARRRSVLVSNGVFTVTKRDYSRLLARYRNRCAYCEKSFGEGRSDRLEWDHVLPLRRGGRHSVGNLIPSCGQCNHRKAVRLLIEWRMGKVVPHSVSLRDIAA